MARKKEWFDDEAFWKEMYPFMFSTDRFQAALEQMQKALALTEPKGREALDLCCGPGRISVALANAGYHVTGVDRTPFLLEKAREAARKAKAKVEWIESDMRDFVRESAYDLILNLFTSFGYFDDKDEDLLVLRNVYESLKPGGVFLIDVMSKERLAKILQPTTSSELDDGTKLIQRHEIFDDWTRIRNEWIIIRQGRAKSFKFHHTIYSGQELKDRLKQAGFRDIRLYGSLTGGEYGPDATRLIAVARKNE